MRRRIFISSPRDKYLDPVHKDLKWAIINEIEALGYEAQVFNPEDGGRGLAQGISWSPAAVERIMKKCVGAVVIGFRFWTDCLRIDKPDNSQKCSLVTEYCHYEGAIARMQKLPILAILEEGVQERLIFLSHDGDAIIPLPVNANKSWVDEPGFRRFLKSWHERVNNRSDIFLGYSSKSKKIAQRIIKYLTSQPEKIKVLDWSIDFIQGDTIINQINKAAECCSGAIFLFTGTDKIVNKSDKSIQLIPRDNVLYEAGYFASVKGNEQVLIISKTGTHIPADLGGIIYLNLDSKKDISGIKTKLSDFVEKNL